MANETSDDNQNHPPIFKAIGNHSKILEQRPRSSGFKSFLNWFKKVENLQKNQEEDDDEETSSVESEDSSSASSTATVASFAFLPANVYKPYGDAQQPEKFIAPGPYTETYHKLLEERNRRRKMDKNLTLRKKYSLYSSGTLPNTKETDKRNKETKQINEIKEYDSFSLPTVNKSHGEFRKTASLSCHVKGKRRAPPPPGAPSTLTARRKRKAPPPPLDIKKEELSSASNIVPMQTKVPESSPVERSPKPWYKRDSRTKLSKTNNKDQKKTTKIKTEYPEIGFFRCSRIFDSKKPTVPDKTEEKRISCYLPNISELDREAAEIIKLHKESNEPCRPSSAKDLINKFNALTNAVKQEESSPKLLKKCNKSPINILRRKNIKDLRDIALTKNENQLTPESSRRFFPEDSSRSNVFKLNQCNRCHAAIIGDNCTSCTNIPGKLETVQSFQEEVFSALPGFNYVPPEKDKSQVYQKLNDLEEKVRLRELLKEMKNSLPKKHKPDGNKIEVKETQPDDVTKITDEIPKLPEEKKSSNKVNKMNNALHSPVEVKAAKVSSSAQTGPMAPRKPLISSGVYSNLKEEASESGLGELLKKLENAIAAGNETEAAKLAKDLALLKVNCSVVTAKAPESKPIEKRIDIFIEDQVSHQGPISIKVWDFITIRELKVKVHKELQIPIGVQRWIIGKQLINDDDKKLTFYNNNNFNLPVFLYIVAPDNKPNNLQKPEPGPSRINQPIAKVEPKKPVVMKDVIKNTWICSACTLINSLWSPLCSACGTKKDAVPEKEITDQTTNKLKTEHYKELLNLDSKDLVLNTDQFDCPICFSECKPGDGVVLRECLHTFCKECLVNVVKYNDEADVKCPYRDRDYSCDSSIQEREIKGLVDKSAYERHLAKSVTFAENKMKNTFHCKTANCKGWCIYEDNANDFLCPVCKIRNCLTCQAIHESKNCKEYQQEMKKCNSNDGTKQMLEEMVNKGEAMMCPSCEVILMKKWGCDWVRCSMCKTEICWVTRGPRWGPLGKGDVSAGCQCGVNGVKCHPKCNYCH